MTNSGETGDNRCGNGNRGLILTEALSELAAIAPQAVVAVAHLSMINGLISGYEAASNGERGGD